MKNLRHDIFDEINEEFIYSHREYTLDMMNYVHSDNYAPHRATTQIGIGVFAVHNNILRTPLKKHYDN